MPQAIITLGKEEDKIVNLVKAHHGLRNKSQAIQFIVSKFREQDLDEFCPICDNPNKPLKESYIKKLDKAEQQKGIPFKDIKELRKIIEG